MRHGHYWLSERRRSLLAAGVGVAVAAPLRLLRPHTLSAVDGAVLVLLAYLMTYLVVTAVAFASTAPARIRSWAERESRGTVLQRYVLGTAPGPGVSIFIAAVAFAVSLVWLPGHGTDLAGPARAMIGVALIAVAWISVVVSYAVTFHADNLLENEKGLDFPGDSRPEWSDYVYFAVSVMATFGTTDVNVTSREMRRTVSINAVIAFVFNTVTVAASVSALTTL
ncbi:DUF1345 domain-containing protein [Luteipulveratus sp. YIM 133132]|uniref:DUF1345 domain-containing protein n=1 Tax=Luteipulveratus flavus TaxID=3031728 RepID=UPI0023B0D921|nr:DUF1345 domain-containing protein [Luteipulveratus sp. YIM 133132]MDE9367391.1 DUF1345 domain-containing protein [Luteipulveratus sp. YIM 133132]